MMLLSLILLFLQAPAPTSAPATQVAPAVVIGLIDEQQLVVENPEFLGFIESRPEGSVLMFRQEKFRGEILLSAVQRIDIGYRKGEPFPLTVTLKNGQKLEVQANRRDFVTIKGRTEFGTITINHPEPVSTTVKITTRRPDRQNDLTIRYLEFR
jgi:hypothetical protein